MAKKQVKTSDLVQKNVFDNTIKSTKDLINVLNILKGSLKEAATSFKQIAGKTSTGRTKSVTELMRAYKASTLAQKESLRITKLEAEADAKIIKLMQEETKQLQQEEQLKQKQLRTQKLLNAEKERTEKALAKEAKATKQLNNEYIKLTKATNEAQFKFKTLAAQFGVNSKQAQRAEKQFLKLDTRLRSINDRAKDGRRDVGRYGTALRGVGGSIRNLAGAFGLFTGVQLVANTIRDAVQTFRQFQLENARLAGLLNTNVDGIQQLTDDAKRLGSTTAKTASEVLALQQAYARLGFSQQEILDLTEASIDGSIALNAQLDETAELTGAVVRTFDDFGTQDAPKILDQLTLATQKSALNFEKLQTALPIVSGAANTAGVSFTQLVSLLGKLSDSGIDASSSATALRNIFIESAAQGLSYEEILDKIINSQDKLTSANDEFGKRAAVSATVLAKNIDAVKDLDEALQGAEGTAKRFADETLDTLDGDIKLLTSAWEGLILAITEGDGVLSDFFRGAVQGLTNFISNLSRIDIQLQLITGSFRDLNNGDFKTFIEFWETDKGNVISNVLDDANLSLKELGKEYNSFVSGQVSANGIIGFLTKETKQMQFLEKIRNDVIKTLIAEGESREDAIDFAERYINLIKQEKEVQEENLEIKKETQEIEEKEIKRLGRIAKLREQIKKASDRREEFFSEESIEKSNLKIKELREELERLLALGKQEDVKEKDFVGLSTTEAIVEAQNRLIKEYEAGNITIVELEEQLSKEILQIQIDTLEEEISLREQAGEKTIDQEKKLNDLLIKQQNENAKNVIDNDKKINKERADILDALFKATADGINKRIEQDLIKIEKRISEIETRRSQLEAAASQGSKDAVDSLVLEAKEQEKLELEAEKRRKQQIQIEASLAAVRIAGQKAAEGKPISDALKDVGTIQAITSAIIAGVPAFYEGTEDTGTVNKALDSNGGRVSILHDNERVMTKAQNQKIGSISNEDLANVGAMYNQGKLISISEMNQLQPIKMLEQPSFNMGLHFKELIKKVDELPNKMPSQSLYYNEKEKAMYEITREQYRTFERKSKIKGGVFK